MHTLTKAGAIAALYIAAAYSAAIPYFLLVVDYPSVVDPIEKVLLLREHYGSMYAMHLLVFECVGIALVVLGIALYDRLKTAAPALARLATTFGLMWAGMLLASSMIFNYGMGAILELHRSDPTRAVWAWQVIEAVAQGIGGAGGELLGGVWMLTVSAAAYVARALPRAAAGFGVVIGVTGLVSTVPALRDAGVMFGVLQIVWFAWVGVVLIRAPRHDRATEVRVIPV